MVAFFFRRVKRFFLRHDWHRMDKHQPEYHEPCDVVCIHYGWHEELGSMYECSLIPNTYYEGFVGPKGLFVSTPRHTYWRHAESFDPQMETKTKGFIGSKNLISSGFSIRWGDPERKTRKADTINVKDTSWFRDDNE